MSLMIKIKDKNEFLKYKMKRLISIDSYCSHLGTTATILKRNTKIKTNLQVIWLLGLEERMENRNS